ncbi:MAG: hypothetical protein B6D61_12260 [Bacteroidetes bacterium 4484_249]|nr:MAG: hypothetical protein B6D61_12260 [Bacteroidetes bacterium 4484_249]
MAIFQKSVINRHLENLDKERVERSFEKFKEVFTPKKIAEIKNLKEEEYQDGFLRDLFVNALGYTLKPDDNFNLVREFKNREDGRKADGAILKDGKAIVVIELKSTKTKDLKKITEQAFNYKNNQPDCKYVITSNFQKLRFYIDYANEFEEFDLFNLQKEGFKLLYLILHKESIFADLPLKLKNETKFHEENISDKLYKDYSDFKHKIYNNLVKNNPQYDKLTLFKKSQKFLDRLLFVFFAEDTGLVPPNAISRIIEQWEALQELDEYKTLYSRFVKFFEHLDKGHKYKTYELPAYNGGLFAPDEILDNITIDDEILKNDALKLSAYDFNTDVDVNILGHIFEHSLNEIEEITAEIEGTETNKTKSRRKKDGVFYTPKYITQYIVENTIGKLCTEKRKELDIEEIEFDGTYKNKDGKLSVKGKKLFKKLNNYKDWLLTLKIVDPACGSGAFLNQALSFLIDEHKHIDDIIAELTGETIRLFDTDKAILENNLYGVDINEESVEIAKLSLWLRTAKKGRKLSNLNANIKCGNSLIDDPEVAGDKAFNWEKEFPQVFKATKTKLTEKEIEEIETKPDYLELIEQNAKLAQEKAEQAGKLSQEAIKYSKKVYELTKKQQSIASEPGELYKTNQGGFDVVIGNPPYGVSFNKLQKRYLSNFDNLVPDFEIYIYFISLATNKLLKQKGKLSYIFPNTFLSILYGQKYRKKILDNYKLSEIVDLSNDNTFTDAAVRTCIFSLSNIKVNDYNVVFKKVENIHNKNIIQTNIFSKQFLYENIDNWLKISSYSKNEIAIIRKIKNNKSLDTFFEISQGLIPYDKYRGHTEYQIKNRVFHSSTKKDDTYKKELKGGDVSRYNISWNGNLWISYGKWLAAPRKQYFFNSPRILVREITNDLLFCSYSEEEYYNTPSLINIVNINSDLSLKYTLTILNSALIGWYHNNTSPKAKKGLFPKILVNDVRNIPIKEISQEAQQPFIEKADKMLELNRQLQEKKTKFLNRIKDNFEIEKISKKLDNFYDFDFKTFVGELKKQKIKLSLVQQDEWEDYFNSYKTGINNLLAEINKTDKEIDQMVYKLYGLTDDEIKIVEERV